MRRQIVSRFLFLLLATTSMTAAGFAMAAGSWAPVGSGLSGSAVTDACTWNSSLVVAGSFASAGATPSHNVAVWDGSQWSSLGDGWDAVYSLTVHEGQPTVFGLRPDSVSTEIAQWNGTSWTRIIQVDRLPFGINPALNRMVSYGGSLYQADFEYFPTWTTGYLYKLEGLQWQEVRSWSTANENGLSILQVLAVVNGELCVDAGPFGEVSTYNGVSWSSYGATDVQYGAGLVMANSELYALGDLSILDPVVSRWSGTAWEAILYSNYHTADRFDGAGGAIVVFDNNVVIHGAFNDGAVTHQRIVMREGSSWTQIGADFDDKTRVLIVYDDNLVAAGEFTECGGVSTPLIAQFEEDPTPVAVSDFVLRQHADGVELVWEIWADEAFDGFDVYRSENGGRDELVSPSRLAPYVRSFVDRDVTPGSRYSYYIVAVGAASGKVRSQRREIKIPVRAAALYQNIPNPFNPSTTIGFVVPSEDHVTIEVYGPSGNRVRTLVSQVYAPGEWSTMWDGTDDAGNRVASGVYYYRMRVGKVEQSKKMVLLK